MNSLQRALYRSLLRCAAEFDREPVLKAFITAGSPKSDTQYRKAVDTFLDNSSFFRPSPRSNQSVVHAVREQFRLPDENSRDPPGNEAAVQNEDAMFHALRNLQNVLSIAQEHTQVYSRHEDTASDHSEEETPFIEFVDDDPELTQREEEWIANAMGGVKREYTPRPGCLLVTHPLQEGWLERSVILITETSLVHGSHGLAFNRPISRQAPFSVNNRTQGSEEPAVMLHVLPGDVDEQVELEDAQPILSLDLTGVATLPTLSSSMDHLPREDRVRSEQMTNKAVRLFKEQNGWPDFHDPSTPNLHTSEAEAIDTSLEIASRQLEMLMAAAEEVHLFRRILPHTMTQIDAEAEQIRKREDKQDAQPSSSRSADEMPDKAGDRLFLGGPVDNNMLTSMHVNSALEGEAIPDTPLRIGVGTGQTRRTLISKQQGARKWGRLSESQNVPVDQKDEIASFFGCCEWQGMQLEDELAAGRWLMFSVDPSVLIAPNKEGTNLRWYHRLPTWGAILEAAGEDYKDLARIDPPHLFNENLHEVE